MAGMEGAVAAPAPPTTWRSLVLDDSPGPSGQVHSTCQVPPAKRQHMEQAHTPAAPALCSSLCGHSGGHEEGARDNDVLQGQVYTVYYRVRCVRCTAGSDMYCVLQGQICTVYCLTGYVLCTAGSGVYCVLQGRVCTVYMACACAPTHGMCMCPHTPISQLFGCRCHALMHTIQTTWLPVRCTPFRPRGCRCHAYHSDHMVAAAIHTIQTTGS